MSEAYDWLTATSRMVVIDTETCTHERVHWLVALAAVEIVNGVIGTTRHWLVNPGVPIDATSHKIHGITDEQVQGAPSFDAISDEVFDFLGLQDDAIWVGHNVGFDVGVLAREYDRARLPLPDQPLLDTMTTLPALAGRDTDTRLNLPELARRLGISGLTHHDPISDATVTAQITTLLLSEVAELGVHADMADVITASGHHTVYNTLTGSTAGKVDLGPVHPEQTPEHIAAHPDPLPDSPTSPQMLAWLRGFFACCTAGCEHARVLAAEFPTHGAELWKKTATRYGKALAGDRLATNTFLDALAPQLETEFIARKSLPSVWVKMRSALTPVGCAGDSLCPSCREGSACPADVFYQSVAEVWLHRTPEGEVPVSVVEKVADLKLSKLRSLAKTGGTDVAGYVAWACVVQAEASTDRVRAGRIRHLAVELNLVEVQPRLVLMTAVNMLADNDLPGARYLVEQALEHRTSDPAFEQLHAYLWGRLVAAPEPAGWIIKTKPRPTISTRRPVERRPNMRFKLG